MDKLQIYFEQMGPNQKREFINDVNRYHLALSINTNSEFIIETTEELFNKYPFLQELGETLCK